MSPIPHKRLWATVYGTVASIERRHRTYSRSWAVYGVRCCTIAVRSGRIVHIQSGSAVDSRSGQKKDDEVVMVRVGPARVCGTLDGGNLEGAAMSFDLEPVDYLRMLKEEYREYRHSPEI